MPAIPGKIDGNPYRDLRLVMPEPIRRHYMRELLWEKITRIRFPVSEKYDAVTVDVLRPGFRQGVTYREKWRRYPMKEWHMVESDWVENA